MSDNDVVVGIDVGLTGLKAVAFDLSGDQVAIATAPTPQQLPKPRWVERDGHQFWDAIGSMCRELTTKLAESGHTVIAVGASAHGDGGWLLDEDLDPVRPGILSLDSRAIGTSEQLNREVGDDLLRVTGQGVFPASSGAVLRWLVDHEPETVARARWFCFAKDFLRARFTDTIGTDLTEASTAFTNVHTQAYDPEALELYGLGGYAHLLPEIQEPADVAGPITYLAHQHSGFPEGVPFVVGMHDVDAGAIGSGGVRPGQLVVLAGTWSINEVISDIVNVSTEWLARSFVSRGRWLNMSVSPASSSNLEWFVNTLCRAEVDAARRAGDDPYAFIDREVGQVKDDGGAVTFFPYLYGNPLGQDASAGFAGIRAWHERGDLLRGIYDGIAFNHRQHVDGLLAGFDVDQVLVVGGVTRSSIWPQLFADTINREITIADVSEGGALGTAMVAAVGAGAYPDLAAAAEAMGSATRTVAPQADGVAKQEERYQAYRSLQEQQLGWWKAQAIG
ncbi:FGGY-family carbohydrate kinase [Micropruina sonneratiae]|uniref:FGGY-family carbohydrate kinase n=1 Tax=Micropruina sonneratiae TaxID=2986940 RepID=UPI002227A3BD|nr:FGGY-family carbohydrate kinase [Micropruina sp. KQZ13P-5]MCW3159497.1 carbohydrate kinase [Micropruina sp. KQZ13P-5]